MVRYSLDALTESLGTVGLSMVPQDKGRLRQGGSPDRNRPPRPRAGGRQMEYSDYLRDQAAEYRRRADASDNPTEKEDLFESAAIYEMVADDLDDRRPAG
jgi:hypothetical protein